MVVQHPIRRRARREVSDLVDAVFQRRGLPAPTKAAGSDGNQIGMCVTIPPLASLTILYIL